MNVDKNDLISGLDLVVPKNPRNGWSKEARKIVNDAIEYINNSVSLDKVKQARKEIEHLDGTTDDYNRNGEVVFRNMVDVEEVLAILDKLIEGEGQTKTSDDCVSRAEVLNQLKEWRDCEFVKMTNPYHYLEKRIQSMPPVTPKHGTCKDCRYIYCEHHEETCDIDEYNPNYYCADFDRRGGEDGSN